MTLAGGENGLLIAERGVGGTDASGVRNGSRRRSSAPRAGGGCRGRWRLEPIDVVGAASTGVVDRGVGEANLSDDEAALLVVEGCKESDISKIGETCADLVRTEETEMRASTVARAGKVKAKEGMPRVARFAGHLLMRMLRHRTCN